MARPYLYFLSALIAGLLYSLIQPPFHLSLLAFFGLIPLFYLTLQQKKLWHAAYIGGFFGLGYSAITIHWLWAAYPLHNLGIQSNLIAFEVLLCIWLVTSLCLAIPWTLLGMGIWRLQRISFKKSFVYYFGIAALVTLTSYISSYAISLTWFNTNAGIGPYFTYGNIAYALNSSPMALHLVSYVGIYGITFLIALINILTWHYVQKKSKAIVIIGGILLLFYIPIPASSLRTPTLHFGLIQTHIPTNIDPNPSEKLSYFKQQLAQLNTLAKEHPETDIVVFPEASDFFNNLHLFLSSAQAKHYFNQLFPNPALIVAGGRIVDTQNDTYSRSFLLDTKKDIIGYHDKQILTPMGEYLPFYLTVPLKLLAPTIYNEYIGNRQFQKGTLAQDTFTFDDALKVSPFICSELLSPSYIRTHLSGTNIIITQTSTSIFYGNSALIAQNLAQVQFRAAENHTPILLSANDGYSYAINSSGIVVNQTHDQDWQILTGTLETGKNDSWYTKVGDFPIITACFALLLSIFIQSKRHEHEN